jgi:DNA polymerase
MDVDQGTAEEWKAVIRGLRTLLQGGQDLGLDPPQASPQSVTYLEARPSRGMPSREGEPLGGSLEELREVIGDCRRCPLHKGRTHLVFGEGNPRAELVFVGEGPGREEDRIGRPFVGEAGHLLTRIIQAMGLRREDVYICNVVKCRPPRNRDPQTDEIRACKPFLYRQLELIGPKVICTLGRIAGRELLGTGFSMTRDRGKWTEYQGIPVMPTFHPAYLLRNVSAKRPVWEDVQEIMKVLGLEGAQRD